MLEFSGVMHAFTKGRNQKGTVFPHHFRPANTQTRLDPENIHFALKITLEQQALKKEHYKKNSTNFEYNLNRFLHNSMYTKSFSVV